MFSSKYLIRECVNPSNSELNPICHLLALLAHHIFYISGLRVNPLKAELNPIYHLLALLGAHHIFHISGLRVKFLIIKEVKQSRYRPVVVQRVPGS